MAPPKDKENPKRNLSLRDFQGVNTQAARQVIGDDQFAWLENVMPVGFGNLKALPGPSKSLSSWSSPAYHMHFVSIADVPFEIIFCTNGQAYAVNLSTYLTTSICVAGTLSGNDSGICQWQNTEVIIVDQRGYFVWNGSGSLVNQVGTIGTLTITTIGTGYTSQPTIGFSGGGGASAAATCDISVATVAINAAGTGYNVNDYATVSGGSFNTAAVVQVSSIGALGAVTGINLVNMGDYTVAPAPLTAVVTTSLYGTGLKVNLTFGIGPITLTNVGSGYSSNPTVGVTLGGGSGGSVTANLLVVPSAGNACATYAGRVWVAYGRTISFTAPGSYNNFSSANAGGSFIMTDETLVSEVESLVSANNFLYIIGGSSINVVADVSVVTPTSGQAYTVFSNTNISASIGTEYEDSVIPYYRSLWFANPYGIYALYGSTTQKMSDDLDGIFPLIAGQESGEIEISGGTSVINEILCACFMVQYEGDATPPAYGQNINTNPTSTSWVWSGKPVTLTTLVNAINTIPSFMTWSWVGKDSTIQIGGDPNWANVSLYLYTNTFVDSSSSNHTMTVVGSPSIDNTGQVFNGVGAMLFNGAGQGVYTPDAANLQLTSGDFTVECWYYQTSGQGGELVTKYDSGAGVYQYLLYVVATSYTPRFSVYFPGYTALTVLGVSSSVNTWHHLAAVRYGNTFQIFQDGIGSGTQTSASNLISTTPEKLWVGCYQDLSNPFAGKVTQVRITKGVARYTSNFTPPTSPFPTHA